MSKPKERATLKIKREVIQRAEGVCEYCQSQAMFSPSPFPVEHIIPKVAQGETTSENLAWSCQGCNNHKHAKTSGLDPETGEESPLYHPRKQQWGDHFRWTTDHLRLLGVTPIGRATVETLHLNRTEVVNLRTILKKLGRHPLHISSDKPTSE